MCAGTEYAYNNPPRVFLLNRECKQYNIKLWVSGAAIAKSATRWSQRVKVYLTHQQQPDARSSRIPLARLPEPSSPWTRPTTARGYKWLSRTHAARHTDSARTTERTALSEPDLLKWIIWTDLQGACESLCEEEWNHNPSRHIECLEYKWQ